MVAGLCFTVVLVCMGCRMWHKMKKRRREREEKRVMVRELGEKDDPVEEEIQRNL